MGCRSVAPASGVAAAVPAAVPAAAPARLLHCCLHFAPLFPPAPLCRPRPAHHWAGGTGGPPPSSVVLPRAELGVGGLVACAGSQGSSRGGEQACSRMGEAAHAASQHTAPPLRALQPVVHASLVARCHTDEPHWCTPKNQASPAHHRSREGRTARRWRLGSRPGRARRSPRAPACCGPSKCHTRPTPGVREGHGSGAGGGRSACVQAADGWSAMPRATPAAAACRRSPCQLGTARGSSSNSRRTPRPAPQTSWMKLL